MNWKPFRNGFLQYQFIFFSSGDEGRLSFVGLITYITCALIRTSG